MKLMTKELEKTLEKYPIYSQDGKGMEAHVVVKYFNPIGSGMWFITEGEKLDNGDWELYGFCHLGQNELAEFGYVRLSDLENIKLPYGMGIERDLHLSKDAILKDELELAGINFSTYMDDKEENVNE